MPATLTYRGVHVEEIPSGIRLCSKIHNIVNPARQEGETLWPRLS